MQLTVADAVVLSLLVEGPKHGYAVHAELERREVKDWAAISRPQIYYSLRKLASNGLLSVKAAEDSLGPERQEYAVTAKGARTLRDRLAQPDWAKHRPPPPFLTWLALCWQARPDDQSAVIEERRAFLSAEILREQATLDAIASDPTVTSEIPRLMVELTVKQFALELAWLDEVRTALARYTEQQR